MQRPRHYVDPILRARHLTQNSGLDACGGFDLYPYILPDVPQIPTLFIPLFYSYLYLVHTFTLFILYRVHNLTYHTTTPRFERHQPASTYIPTIPQHTLVRTDTVSSQKVGHASTLSLHRPSQSIPTQLESEKLMRCIAPHSFNKSCSPRSSTDFPSLSTNLSANLRQRQPRPSPASATS
jgi:hypothetical protein